MSRRATKPDAPARGTVAGNVRRARRRLAARPLPLRPTVAAVIAFEIASVLLVLSAGTASIALMAGCVALACALAWGLVSAILGWVLSPTWCEGDQDGARGSTGARVLRAIAARPVSIQTTWLRLDQRGRVIDQVAGNLEPEDRGLYCTGGSVVRTRDLFGFWITRRAVASTREMWIPPRAHDLPVPEIDRLAGRAPALAPADVRERSSALVRPYEKGDPLRAISWRQSAHHGQLMSFELEREHNVYPVVVVDTLEVDDIESLAAEAYTTSVRLAAQRGARDEVLVTDGRARAVGMHRVGRLLAALQPDAPQGGEARRREAARRSAQIARDARHGAGAAGAARPVVLITDRVAGALEDALRSQIASSQLAVVHPRATGGPEAPDAASRHREDALRPHRARRRRPGAASAPAPTAGSALASALCCVVVLLETFSLAATLIEPGAWWLFGQVVSIIVALEATCVRWLPRTRTRPAVRMGIYASVLLLICGSAAFGAASLIGMNASLDVFSPDTSLEQLGIDGNGGGLGWIAPVCARGIYDLYFGQWVPVSCSPVSDAALVLLMAPVAAVLHVLLVSHRPRPVVACLPLALLAVRFVFMGAASEFSHIAISVFCGLALRAFACAGSADDRPVSAQPGVRRRGPLGALASLRPTALASCAAATIVACLLAPQAAADAQRLPLDTGLQSNVLASNTVSPIMDLKRDLTRPQETIALTYTTTSRQPLYLRLTTLGDFSGDVWRIDAAPSAGSGGLLEQLFSPADPTEDMPQALPGSWTSPDAAIETVRNTNATSVGSIRSISARISIDALSSRFAPLPIGAYDTQTADDQSQGDWRWSPDGSVFGTQAITNRSQVYAVDAAYISPITDSSSLSGIGGTLIGSLQSRIWSASPGDTTSDWQARRDSWQELLDQEHAEVDGAYLALPDELPDQIARVVDLASQIAPRDEYDELTGELTSLEFLLEYFNDPRFTYSLDAPDGDGQNNLQVIASFLDSGEGYCLHYASAFAVLGRALGVPTRIALGYRTSDGQAGDTYVVTNRDLHAWTEAYLYGVGWVPFDVTPGQGELPEASIGRTLIEQDEPDSTQQDATTPASPLTPDAPVQPDTPTQQADGGGDGGHSDATDPVQHALSQVAAVARQAAPFAGAGAIIAAILLGPRAIRRARYVWRMRAVAGATSQPVRAAEAAWSEMLHMARTHDVAWPAHATEEDIAGAVAKRAPRVSDAARSLADAVCRARYDQPDNFIKDAEALQRALGDLRAALEEQPGTQDGAD